MAKPDRKPDPDVEPNYDVADPDYDEVDSYRDLDSESSDPDYDEAAQPDYETDVRDPDAPEASQEYYKRSQK